MLLTHVVLGLVLTLISARQKEGEPPTARHRRLIRWWHRRLCNILHVNVTVHGSATTNRALYVANHISWLDIPVIGSVADVGFLSKIEVRHWPLVGWLAARNGTLFIERGGRDAASAAAEAMTWHLVRKRPVLVFPEGTTTQGHNVRRFHPRLFGAAILADCPVQPIAMRYAHCEQIHPTAPFVHDAKLLSHLWQILGEDKIDAELTFCNVVSTKVMVRNQLAEEPRMSFGRVFEVAEQARLQSHGR